MTDAQDERPDGADLSDAALIQRIAAAQDRAAFADLFGRYAGRVKGFLMRWGMAADQAEEAAQEVMVSVWRRAGSFDADKAAVSTWIFAIARNRRIDMIRKASRRELDPDDPLWERDPEPDSAEILSVEQRAALVRAALNELPAAQADLLRLSFYEGLSHGECAERLSLPLGTVKSRIRLAFAKLRDTLGDGIVEELWDD
ncbi:RNA polymerase sigma-70 factor (ECF subfamily) [Rubricella aquisinus]|uniref:RNA polymerase sigma-70 factor (ECF subfamily) n=1 Tax=Rubricella aquisinus TaxID=2028108 RepID=A0A840X869_9RHOB|nr:sigma-70 family RNA polymerase sigma factor [Rubricella aquisinus]MBB5516917.1 RNA polymerase sigma-70 factor (ECF subfamily) [Rubricella aquisinus]